VNFDQSRPQKKYSNFTNLVFINKQLERVGETRHNPKEYSIKHIYKLEFKLRAME